MIGVLGRLWCHAVTVSQPSFTGSPQDQTITDWDSIDSHGPSWITGGSGPYQGAVPVDGGYQVTINAEVNATDPNLGGAPTDAGFFATFEGAVLALWCPPFTDDTNGTAWISAAGSAILELAAGTPLEVAITAHDASVAVLDLGVHSVKLDIVRLS